MLTIQISLSFVISIAFAIKVPIFPFHLWLPEVHTETYTSGSVLLAGILLKLGVYGLIRFNLFPIGIKYWFPLLFSLCITGCLMSSIYILTQLDLKKIIAYSSISHMNFTITAWSTCSLWGNMGCVITSLAHGLSSTSLFILSGCLYDRTHSINLQPLFNYMPVLSSCFLLLILANISFPGTWNFIGELFGTLSVFRVDISLISILLFNALLTTCYSFFNMSIILIVIVEVHKDTNRIEFSLFSLVLFLVL